MQIEKALEKANKDNLDLVQVSPKDSDPVVCKLLDYGKYVFDKKKIFQTQNQRLEKHLSKRLNLDHQLIQATIILN